MFESRATRHVVFLGRHLAALLDHHALPEALVRLDAAAPSQYQDDSARLRDLLTGESSAPPPLGLSPFKTMATLMPKEQAQRARFFRGFMDYVEQTRSVFHAYWSGLVGLMAYLLAIGLVAVVVLSLYSLFVAPQLTAMLQSFGQRAPGLTRFAVGGSGFGGVLAALLVALAIALSAGAMVLAHRRIQQLTPMPATPRWVPFFGRLARTYNQGLFLNFARVLMRAGLPTAEALKSAADASHQPDDTVPSILSADTVQSDTIVTELSTAARLGQLDIELEHQCDQHIGTLVVELSRVRDRFALILKLALFFIVGGLVVAMYLPLFKMGQTF